MPLHATCRLRMFELRALLPAASLAAHQGSADRSAAEKLVVRGALETRLIAGFQRWKRLCHLGALLTFAFFVFGFWTE